MWKVERKRHKKRKRWKKETVHETKHLRVEDRAIGRNASRLTPIHQLLG
jgi:hypothetical protein